MRLSQTTDLNFAHCPQLSRAQERDYGRLAQEGCSDSREILIRSQLPLVKTLSNRYLSILGDFDETFSLGQESLLRAVDHFQPARGRLCTYFGRIFYFDCLKAQKELGAPAVETAVRPEPTLDEDPAEQMYQRELIARMVGGLGFLSDRERLIVEERGKGETFASLAPRLGISKERCRQVHKSAIDTLRTVLRDYL